MIIYNNSWDNYPTSNIGFTFGDANYIAYAMPFFDTTLPVKLKKITVVLQGVTGKIAGTITVGIRAESGAKPTGGNLTSGTISGAALTLDPDTYLVRSVDVATYTLIANTQYFIVLSSDGDLDGVMWVGYDNGDAGVNHSTDDGVTWDFPGGDSGIPWYEAWGDPLASPRATIPIKDVTTLEAIRNIEMSAMGRAYIDEKGHFIYESRYTRSG